MIRISVVTVCKNVELTIADTIKSVLEQDYSNVEYIIQDGKSTDETENIIKKYAEQSPITYISEMDSGLYDAMNRAVEKCHGDYVVFLNSGDVFCDSQVLSDVAKLAQKDIVIGNVIRIFTDGRQRECYYRKRQILRSLFMGKMPCHQVIFTKTDILRKIQFDLRFSICADFDFIVRCMKKKYSFQCVDRDMCIVDCVDGISSQNENLESMRKQDDLSLKENYPICFFILYPLKYTARKVKDAKKILRGN